MKFNTILLGGLIVLAAGALAQEQPAPAAPPAPKAVRLLSAVFLVSDLERSLAFYTKGLGLAAPMRMDHPGALEVPLVLPGGGANLLLVQHKAPHPGEAPMFGRVVIDVPDIHAMERQLKAAGYALSEPIGERAQYHLLFAKVKDPDGNELELVQRPHTRSETP